MGSGARSRTATLRTGRGSSSDWSSWRLALLATAGVLSLGSACGGKSAQHFSAGQGGAQAAGTGARGGANTSGGRRPSSAGAMSNSDSGEGGAALDAGSGGRGGRGGGASISGTTGAGGGVVPAAGDGGAVAAAGEGGANGGLAGEAGAGGILECADCSLPSEMCVVGVCDVELGRCTRLPVVACQSGDGCCPTGCTQDDDADCTSFRVVLAPAYSGNRSQDGAPGPTTFAGVMAEQRFHAFFTFDLSGIDGTIVSAELDLYYEGYFSSDPEEPFIVRTVPAPIDALLDNAVRTDVFDALQSGAYCFDTAMTPEHVGSIVALGLSETALADLNASLGSPVAFGIVADGAVGDSSNVQGIRFSDGVNPPLERLTLIVEP